MKIMNNRAIAFLLALILSVSLIATVSGCASDSKPIGDDNTSALAVDLDYSKYSASMLYDTINKFSADSEHNGKTVKIKAEYGGFYNSATNTYINVIEKFDSTACCAAFYQVVLAEGITKPAIGSTVEIVGTFENGFISVSALTLYKGSFDNTAIDIDASNMTRSDLDQFLKTIKSVPNEYTGKTVRICGHYAKSSDGFSYVVGYEQNALGGNLTAIWDFEVHSETVEFPVITDNYMNSYEIIGTVSSYQTAGQTWPCIEVQSIRPITTFTAQ